MVWKKRKFSILVVAVLVVGFLFYGGLQVNDYLEWQSTKDAVAAGGYPYQIGLTGVTVIPCTVSCNGSCCMGGSLCSVKDPATCTMYSYVQGTPAGGSGNQALFLKTALSQAGVSAGSQLIAGGMGPTMMDSGVLGGPTGCYNCMAKKENFWEKTKRAVDYMIAAVKE